ncbi:MAG TPA: GDSL-type esterase/lipase family protein, partial [Herpetosiphonaceae bacterium]|nr:GDSL-type esterase/lipase family protein [Herpetosiphonaceae bacterium]
LGDSYTIGEGVAAEERWPEQLVQLLRAEGIGLAAPGIVARTGWTAGELIAGITQAHPNGVFDLVSLLIGVNNQYRGLPPAEFESELLILLRHAVALAGGCTGRVLVASIPDWSVTPFAVGRDRARIAEQIDAFNRIKRAATVAAGARFVNITPISRVAGAEPEMLARDGLHPSGAMYSAWAHHMLPAARAAMLGHDN